jgi:hypothetical protein
MAFLVPLAGRRAPHRVRRGGLRPRASIAAFLVVAALLTALLAGGCAGTPPGAGEGAREAPAVEAAPAGGLRLSWKENLLRVEGEGIPGGPVEVWYLEAFCRSGSTRREWGETVIPHRTELVEASPGGKRLRLRSEVEGGVVVEHDLRAGTDEVDFEVRARNDGPAPVDAVWAQPCVRVGAFTGRERQGHVLRGEEEYIEKCFIFVGGVLRRLHETRRESEALYRGGQVYVPAGIDRGDVNPRPLSPDVPSHGLIGCFSADGRRLLAFAWEPYQELFQGVILCIHSDFRLGGLAPGETKSARGKLYLMENDVARLLARYRRDFPGRADDGARGARGARGAERAAADPAAAALPAEPAAAAAPDPAAGWRLGLFEPISERELAEERELHAALGGAWERGDGARAFELASAALRAHPARRELHLLRAASVLVAFGALEAPFSALRGEAPAAAETGAIPLAALLFLLDEYQRVLPELPPALAPWTGLYHPYAEARLIGAVAGVWSHGLRPLARLHALAAGEVLVFEALESGRPSLADILLKAELLAARGEAASARALLAADLSAYVSPDSWPRWRERLAALREVAGELAGPSPEAARAALAGWEAATREAIPELRGALIALPAAALERARSLGAARGTPEGAAAPLPEIPSEEEVLALLREAARAASAPGAGATRGAAPGPERGETDLRSELREAALRLRDFRADVLRRVAAGDSECVLSAGLVREGGLRFEEAGELRVAFVRAAFLRTAEGGEWPEGTARVPCGEGFWLVLP